MRILSEAKQEGHSKEEVSAEEFREAQKLKCLKSH
jgi:hypothetical protein